MRTATVLLMLMCLCGLPWIAAGQGSSFDKLSEADKQAFTERFRRELWPLLSRGGKDGCVGCHHTRHQSGLRLSGDADADFRAILREGFFLKGDPGSMLASVTRADGRRRMPPGNRSRWSEPEIRVLQEFVQDLDKKQRR